MIGTTIGHYAILAKLGEGGMGTVWKAQHTLLPDRIVALKLLAESLWSSEDARQRFLREAMAVSRLDTQRGIAALYDAEYIEGRLAIAFQFIDGDTVARKTAAGPLILSEAVAIAADAAEALAHAHARGVLHRDVSAGNVMVDREGRGVLVDFGLAHTGAHTQLTRTGTTQGTLPYLAPEVWRGEKADARSDLYGLGVVLYRMVTGREPFQADSIAALEYQVQHEPPSLPSTLRPEIPPEVDDLVLRLLQKRPGDRPGSAKALAAELNRLQGLPALKTGVAKVVPTPGQALRRRLFALRRWLRTRAGGRGLAAAVALTVLVGIAAIAWQRGWRPGAAPRIPRVAILPARNLSADTEETAYLAEGLGEEIASRLAEISGLQLIPWLTTQRFTDPSQPLSKVAQELQADALVVGSYRSDGERIRVTVTVVDGRRDVQRWSQSYEESVENLFELQKSVAFGLASQFKPSLTAEEREKLAVAPSTSADAYDHFIQGANKLRTYDPLSIASAELFFKKAIELDPALEEAWVGLGAINTDRYFRGDGGDAELKEAERCYRRALELHPGHAAAERGMVRVHFERGEAEEILKVGATAARRGPDDIEALQVRGWAYTLGGLPEKAIPIFDRVLELDPANQGAAWYRVVAEAWAERYPQAIDHARAYLRRYGDDAEVYTWLGVSWHAEGKTTEARLCFERALELFGDELSNMYVAFFTANLYGQLGEQDRMRELATRWVAILESKLDVYPDNFRMRAWLAGLYAILGRRADVERTVDQFLGQVSGRRDFPSGMLFLFPGFLASVGSTDRVAAVCSLMQSGELASASSIARPWAMVGFRGNGAGVSRASPEFKALVGAVQQRLAELAARY